MTTEMMMLLQMRCICIGLGKAVTFLEHKGYQLRRRRTIPLSPVTAPCSSIGWNGGNTPAHTSSINRGTPRGHESMQAKTPGSSQGIGDSHRLIAGSMHPVMPTYMRRWVHVHCDPSPICLTGSVTAWQRDL